MVRKKATNGSVSGAEQKRNVTDSGFYAAQDWYKPFEISVLNWSELVQAISHITQLNKSYQFVWRGLPNADFANLSSLARHQGQPEKLNEFELRRIEARNLRLARETWRIDTSQPELFFAKLQHLGAPTRLIDVTRNAMVAAWFATETKGVFAGVDGRILGFATESTELPDLSYGSLDAKQKQLPIWHVPKHQDTDLDWGSYKSKVTVWFPPAITHPRIFAQSAGFIYDGIPKSGTGSNNGYSKGPTTNGKSAGKWKLEEIRKSTSVHVALVDSTKKIQQQTKTPMVTIKISMDAKSSIREFLVNQLSINFAFLFPEEQGIAKYLSSS